MIGLASASTLAITGSSIVCGSLARTRDTRSRTSLAPAFGSLSSRKRTVIWLCSAREIDVSTSMPSIPASESSSGLVIWDSTTSELAPGYRVSTVTTGSSIFGYSRMASLLNDTRPISTMISDMTVAKTGRRMQMSDKTMMRSGQFLAMAAGAAAALPGPGAPLSGFTFASRDPFGCAMRTGVSFLVMRNCPAVMTVSPGCRP